MIKKLCEIYEYRNVLKQLVAQQLILRYRRTALGYLWTLVNPLLMMSVMAVVFSNLYNIEIRKFAIFLFAGMVPWNFFSSAISQSCSALINNEGLIKKIYLPKIIFPLSVSVSLLIDSVLSFLALILIILLLGGEIGRAITFIPISYALLWLFTLGLGFVVSLISVYFRDMQHIIVIVLQGLFFLSPVLYKNETLSGRIKWVVEMNPISTYIELFRGPLLSNSLPELDVLVNAIALSTLSISIGLIMYFRNEKNIVFRL